MSIMAALADAPGSRKVVGLNGGSWRSHAKLETSGLDATSGCLFPQPGQRLVQVDV